MSPLAGCIQPSHIERMFAASLKQLLSQRGMSQVIEVREHT
jgi:hypothetical protein